MEKTIQQNIPKEKFEFANNSDKIFDQKLDTKPIGYFKDALIRFSKNKASITAAIIIILIILFALTIPICTTPYKKTNMDTYYAKKGPRVEALYDIGLNGGAKDSYSETSIIKELAKGVAAEYKYDATTTLSLGEAQDSKYSTVIKINQVYEVEQDKTVNTIYDATIDTYLSIGFIYRYFTIDEYNTIHQWELETGNQVFYPLVNESDNVDTTDANFWYKMKTKGKDKGIPIDGNGKKITVSEERPLESIVLQDNYKRDSEGNLVYYVVSGVTGEQYTTRVLYYNYYQYLNSSKPNYLFGTDSQGYDLAYRMARGIQLSLLLAIIVSSINFVLGAMYGAIEGYYGGAVDLVLERISDILIEVPFIVVATLFQMHLAKKVGAVPSLIFAFIMTGWIGTASRVRTQFYRFKNQEYVMAARTLGAKDKRIIWKHIFPNTLGTIITSSVLVIPGVIFSESMLSYLGIVNLGGTDKTSLGTLLSDASSLWTLYPHLMFFPAAVISLLMICFNLFGNGLRDAFNPTLRGADE